MVRGDRFREMALSFEGALEVPHFDRAAFRTKKRIFATMPADGASANLLLDRDLQEAICEALPDAFAPVPGGWGRMGYTRVDLRRVSEAHLRRALTEAHARASVSKRPSKPKPASAKRARSTRR